MAKSLNDNLNFLIYQGADGKPIIDVRIENETVWLSQVQLADLYQTLRTNITMHLKNIFDNGELNEISLCKDFLLTTADGKSASLHITTRITKY